MGPGPDEFQRKAYGLPSEALLLIAFVDHQTPEAVVVSQGRGCVRAFQRGLVVSQHQKAHQRIVVIDGKRICTGLVRRDGNISVREAFHIVRHKGILRFEYIQPDDVQFVCCK